MFQCVEVLDVACSYLDCKSLMNVAQVNRPWRVASLVHLSLTARSFFRGDWVQDPVELALPSHVLAMSVSMDEVHLYVCARGSEDDDGEDAFLYLHHLPTGQRNFERLPATFSRPDAQITFEGPDFLVATCRDGTLAVFDCDRGMEVVLPSDASTFCVSSSGEYVGVLTEDVYYVLRFGPMERRLAIERATSLWSSSFLMQQDRHRQNSNNRHHNNTARGGLTTRFAATSLSSPTLPLLSSSRCPSYLLLNQQETGSSSSPPSVPMYDSTVLRFPNADSFIDNLADVFIAKEMLITLQTGRLLASLKSYFHEGVDDRSSRRRRGSGSGSIFPRSGEAADSSLSDDGRSVRSEEAATTVPNAGRDISFLFTSTKCMPRVEERPDGGCVYLLDASTATLYIWQARSGLARAVHFPQLFVAGITRTSNLRRRSEGSDIASAAAPPPPLQEGVAPHGVAAAPPSTTVMMACEYLRETVEDTVVCFTTWRRDTNGYVLHFATVDGSLHHALPLKGKSLVTQIPREAQVVVSLWTAASGPAHPLLEATEYGIGTILSFGRGCAYVKNRAVQQKGNRIVCITWISVAVMVLSFLTTVVSLVYNGWWLHMQFLFAPESVGGAVAAAAAAVSEGGANANSSSTAAHLS